MFRKILIANRGEIAVRILRACRELSVPAAVVYSDADRASLHVRLADEAYRLGPAPSRESYLAIDKILAAARAAGCDAVHPGYGFLAENHEFARACAAAGITFIGPSPEAMAQLGSKTAARHLAKQEGVPTVPGALDPIANLKLAGAIAKETGFPVVLKAVAGGGGKGMRLVEREAELVGAWRDATSEAENAFGDGRLYLEKYLARPRHIEIQVIEEAPSPVMSEDLRRAMGEAAVKLARAGGYTNAGTVEFLVDADRQFYFLEMNTRLQVEHPVTELVTSLDLVKWQIRIAAGEKLLFEQGDIAIRGHAIECRIYAEDPDNNFFPSPGKILDRRVPSGPGVRMDDGVYAGWTVPNEYDPLLGKLIVWGGDRAEAMARLRRALGEYYATGIKTNISLFRRILDSRDFQAGEIYTRWLDDFLQRPPLMKTASEDSRAAIAEDAAILAAALWQISRARTASAESGDAAAPASLWKREGRREQLSRDPERSSREANAP
jgi:acetyl-CoA carboxylase biotin carboxylase subunit